MTDNLTLTPADIQRDTELAAVDKAFRDAQAAYNRHTDSHVLNGICDKHCSRGLELWYEMLDTRDIRKAIYEKHGFQI